MCAAEYQRIYTVFFHLLQIGLGGQTRYLIACPALLCKGHEQRARLREHNNRRVNSLYCIEIRPASYSSFSSYYADSLGFCHLNSLSCAWTYHAYHGYRQLLLQLGQAICRGSVAGNNQKLYVKLQKKPCILKGVPCNSFNRLCAIRHSGGIAEINSIFPWHDIQYFFQHSKPAYAGIKYAYWFSHCENAPFTPSPP